MAKRKPSAAAQIAAKRRLGKLDQQAKNITKNKLRAQATMGSRSARRQAASALGSMSKPKQFRGQ